MTAVGIKRGFGRTEAGARGNPETDPNSTRAAIRIELPGYP